MFYDKSDIESGEWRCCYARSVIECSRVERERQLPRFYFRQR